MPISSNNKIKLQHEEILSLIHNKKSFKIAKDGNLVQ